MKKSVCSRILLLFWLVLILIQTGRAETAAFTNGRWFDGANFRPVAVLYAADGRLTAEKPRQIDRTYDLAGRYVIPPFGDAHQHIFNLPETIDEEIESFLRMGVFYVMIQDAIGPVRSQAAARVNRPESVDVVYTTAPLIGPGHGLIDYFKSLGGEEQENSAAELDGKYYFQISDKTDLRGKWPRILETNKDFLKVILAFSEEDRKRRSDRRYYTDPERLMGRPGIRPDLLPEIVRRAHRSGRRVSVHIETAADFRLAVWSGADFIAHLPGWHIGPTAGFADDRLSHWLITDADARLAAGNGVAVITTAYPKPFFDNEKLAADFRRVHRENLTRLKKQGVRLAIGSDNAEVGVIGELRHLSGFGVFDRRELIKIAAIDTPRLIFPKRRIGFLREGFEASFLVLEADPLEDLDALRKIKMRVKQGRVLEMADKTEGNR